MGGIGGDYSQVNTNSASDPASLAAAADQFTSVQDVATRLQADTNAISKAITAPDVWQGQSTAAFTQLSQQLDQTMQGMVNSLAPVASLLQYASSALQAAIQDLVAINTWGAQMTEWWYNQLVLSYAHPNPKPQLPNGVWTPIAYPEIDQQITVLAKQVAKGLDTAFGFATREIAGLASSISGTSAPGGGAAVASPVPATPKVPDPSAVPATPKVPDPSAVPATPKVPAPSTLPSPAVGANASAAPVLPASAGVTAPSLAALSNPATGGGFGGSSGGSVSTAPTLAGLAALPLAMSALGGTGTQGGLASSGGGAALSRSLSMPALPTLSSASIPAGMASRLAALNVPGSAPSGGVGAGSGGIGAAPSLSSQLGVSPAGGSLAGSAGSQAAGLGSGAPGTAGVGAAGSPFSAGSGANGVGADGVGTIGAGSGTAAASGGVPASGSSGSSGGMPFMPPMGGAGGAGGKGTGDRERATWLTEDRDVWGTDDGVGPMVVRAGASGDVFEPEFVAADSQFLAPERPTDAPIEVGTVDPKERQATAT
jgi:uncharacterized protein YukE